MRLILLAALLATPALAADPAPAPVEAAPTVEKMICKSRPETGSLVKRKKTCLTRAQWQAVNEQNESAAQKMVHDNQSRPSGQ